ncbi:hypothetical protein Goshw_022460 [Gossypium schwendimanii]|uniref:Uncharacterized protein n=1 Tax=Gossypium schwendimanii TaxID=34291 RepID=A0A7J9NCE4_GOSSC|nr:hypothetical protein [Gossypium schwendimanii]
MERNNTLEAMMMALKEEIMAITRALSTRIEELEEELALCRAAMGKGVTNAALSNEDVLKPKEYVGTMSAYNVDNFLWRIENYFHAKGIVDDAVKPVVKLGLGKDKLGSSKFEEMGICEMDHKEDIVDGNGNGDDGGNEKPRVEKKKPKRKMDKLKCFLCDGLHMLKKCPKKFALKEKLVGKALILGSSARGVDAKEAKSKKKPVECFFCHGSHRLRKYPIEAKRAKRSKKKRVKCFLCHGPHELRNCPKQAKVKGKATFELGESSEGLSPKEEVILPSNLKGKVMIKTVKLRPMRLELSEASELVESSTRLPPMGKVGGASDFKEKEVMHVRQLTRVNAKVYSEHFDSVLHSNLLTLQERRGPFEFLSK